MRPVVTHRKGKGEVFLLHFMKEYKGTRGTAPLILNLASEVKGQIYSPSVRAPDLALTFWRREISFASFGIRTHNLVATPTTLPRIILQASVVGIV